MPVPRSRLLLLLVLTGGLCAPGCVYRNGVSTCRFWADYNTLQAPAIYFEETEHLPYRAPRVEYFRWMYNTGTPAQQQGELVVPSSVAGPPGEAPPLSMPVPVRPRESPRQEPVPVPAKPAPESTDSPGGQLPPLPSTPDASRNDKGKPAPVVPAPQPAPPANIDATGPTAAVSPSPSRRGAFRVIRRAPERWQPTTRLLRPTL